METILKEVLIKKCGNRLHDQVLIIENLPSKFLYELVAKMIPRVDRDGYMDGSMVVDPSGEKVLALYHGIEKSRTGDGGYVFWMNRGESEKRLKDIMRFIDAEFPRDQRIPEFIDNAQMRGESNSGPLAYSQIPRITLPLKSEIMPPRENLAPVQVPSHRGLDKQIISPERREQLRANLAKARAAKKPRVAA